MLDYQSSVSKPTFDEIFEICNIHWPFVENIYKAMSNEGDLVLENHVVSALHLLLITKVTGDERYASAACRALNYALPMLVADGGDAWETPIKAPNLLAAGHAAIAYELAYRACSKPEYREKAIYWLRSLLTHRSAATEVPVNPFRGRPALLLIM